MSGTVLQCIYYKVGEREFIWISLPLKREGKFVLPCVIPLGQYSLRNPAWYMTVCQNLCPNCPKNMPPKWWPKLISGRYSWRC